MNDFKKRKDYLDERRKIYIEKNDKVFESKIQQLYKNKSIRVSWRKKELKTLQKDNSNFITYIGLFVSSLVAAFATSIIKNPDELKQIRDVGILAVLKTSGILIPFLIIIGLIIFVGVLILLIPITAVSISTNSLNRKNYEIDQIISSLTKPEIKKIFDSESKLSLIVKLLKDSVAGIIVGILATVIVWFSM